jgi:hypothetical protein
LFEHCEKFFRDGCHRPKNEEPSVEELYQKIGRLEVENNFLKKNLKCFRHRETVIGN